MKQKKNPDYRKPYGPLASVLLDPVTVPLTKVSAALRISPNVITGLSLLAGFVSGFVFATGHWFWGSMVFQFAYFCDCLDGKVARLRGVTSEFGAKLENISDSTRKPSSFLGIAVYFYLQDQLPFAILTAVALFVHVAVHKLYSVVGVLEYDLAFPNFTRKVLRRIIPRSLAIYTFFEEQFIEFVVFPLIAVAVGLPEGGVWFFYGAIVVTLLSLGKLCLLWNHRRKGRYEEVYQDWAGTKGNLDQPKTGEKN